MSSLQLVHVVPDMRRQAGGIASAVPLLCRALKQAGVRNTIVTLQCDPDLRDDPSLSGIVILPQSPAWRINGEFARRFPGDATQAVIHNHGLWHPLNHAAARTARSTGRPLVTSLHGMLMPWARRHKRWKKALAWTLYQRSDLRASRFIHVTSETEREHLASAGVSTPAVVARYGVELEGADKSPDSYDTRSLVFLGRIHPVKNLSGLLDAWAQTDRAGWRLTLAGPDEVGHLAELRRQVVRLKIEDAVEFVGPVYDADKWRLLKQASALVLPSFYENFGMSVAEALAVGAPVIATVGTPWAEIEAERCGWLAQPDVAGLKAALSALCATDAASLRDMGTRARSLIARDYSWGACAQKLCAAYAAAVKTRPPASADERAGV